MTTSARESDQCFTPEWIFRRMRIGFDLDVAAPIGGVPWVPAKRFFSHRQDGLKLDWRGRVWMNPPFSKPQPWVEKFVEHGNGVALLPMSKSRWFHRLWDSEATFVFPPPHLKFVKDGRPHGIFMPIVLVAFGEICVRAIKRLGTIR